MVRSTLLPGENLEMIGPTARLTLRHKSDFLKEVLGTPAQTALGHTRSKKDLPITVIKPGIDKKVRRTRAKNWKVTRAEWSFFSQKSFFSKSVQIDPKVSYMIRKWLAVSSTTIFSPIGGVWECVIKSWTTFKNYLKTRNDHFLVNFFSKRVQIDPKVSYMIRKSLVVFSAIILSSIGRV